MGEEVLVNDPRHMGEASNPGMLPRGRGNNGGRGSILCDKYPPSSSLDRSEQESSIGYLLVCSERGPLLHEVPFRDGPD